MLVTLLYKDNKVFCGDYFDAESFLIEEEFNNEKKTRDQIIEDAIWGTSQMYVLNENFRILAFFNCVEVIHVEKKPFTFVGFLHRYEELVTNSMCVLDESRLLDGYSNLYTWLFDNHYEKLISTIKELRNS